MDYQGPTGGSIQAKAIASGSLSGTYAGSRPGTLLTSRAGNITFSTAAATNSVSILASPSTCQNGSGADITVIEKNAAGTATSQKTFNAINFAGAYTQVRLLGMKMQLANVSPEDQRTGVAVMGGANITPDSLNLDSGKIYDLCGPESVITVGPKHVACVNSFIVSRVFNNTQPGLSQKKDSYSSVSNSFNDPELSNTATGANGTTVVFNSALMDASKNPIKGLINECSVTGFIDYDATAAGVATFTIDALDYAGAVVATQSLAQETVQNVHYVLDVGSIGNSLGEFSTPIASIKITCVSSGSANTAFDAASINIEARLPSANPDLQCSTLATIDGLDVSAGTTTTLSVHLSLTFEAIASALSRPMSHQVADSPAALEALQVLESAFGGSAVAYTHAYGVEEFVIKAVANAMESPQPIRAAFNLGRAFRKTMRSVGSVFQQHGPGVAQEVKRGLDLIVKHKGAIAKGLTAAAMVNPELGPAAAAANFLA
uniref:Uncharacterized protein n=1 Tax=viral metagenome TaxID=1070528 RepID=A0A2V0R8Z6_9ZZZZ